MFYSNINKKIIPGGTILIGYRATSPSAPHPLHRADQAAAVHRAEGAQPHLTLPAIIIPFISLQLTVMACVMYLFVFNTFCRVATLKRGLVSQSMNNCTAIAYSSDHIYNNGRKLHTSQIIINKIALL